jgi:hypothetical protein
MNREKCGRVAPSVAHPTRRSYLRLAGGAALARLVAWGDASAEAPANAVVVAIKEFSESPELSYQNYSFREFAENFPALQLERAPSRLKPSNLTISEDARNLILACEVSSEAVYTQRYQRPTWPGGHSGVTIGIGYDLGYATKDDLQFDWNAIVSSGDLTILKAACGVTGKAAQDLAPTMNNVRVTFAQATKEFDIELRKYIIEVPPSMFPRKVTLQVVIVRCAILANTWS